MNIAKIMIPKVSIAFLYENNTIRQGLERFTAHGYTAVPVLNECGEYAGCVTEGDFLRFLLRAGTTDKKVQEQHRIRELVRTDFCPPLSIDAPLDEAVDASLGQNFVPIVDSRGVLCGILTRRAMIEHLAELSRKSGEDARL
ncbi:MAG: CBS domain-containing protein [Eubacteriales bacterium]|nr:CBS domain-containing protein [Eubacteriales bacterium]